MRGHIRPRGDKSWAIVLDLGRDENGKRQQKWHSVKGTEKDAEKELTRLLGDIDGGRYTRPQKLTVAEYLKVWLDDHARHRLSARSFDRYESEIKTHLIPCLGRLQLTALTALAIQNCYSQALKGRAGRPPLAPQSVKHLHAVLLQALRQAVRQRLLTHNPAVDVDPPRPQHRTMRPFTRAEVALLLKAAQGSRHYMPLLLGLGTGMRRNEILGLRWSDVDLAAGRLSVRQALEKSKAGLAFKAPKTAKGRRPIDLSASLVEALVRHKGEQASIRLQLGPAYQDHNLVVCRPDGRPVTPSVLTRAFRDFAKRLSLPSGRFHDLRHTHATLLLEEGVNPKVVSERLGHTSVVITLNTYSHVLPDIQAEAARRLDSALREAMGGL